MLVIVLSVTMVILNGIAYISKSGMGEDPSKARRNLMYIAIGILVALFSVVIINLMRSIGESTLEKI
jgi:multisubunit Na+/H+ antiporter MnhB subunit